ncbi:MAG: T9SS type A sorting domain-containing protein [Candidatus Kapabacteria bacterium]|nr:T9SS type A sorting domain-containing protein [Candidatus Kapabacteria bacterium]
MKTIILFFVFTVSLNAQIFDSSFVGATSSLSTKGNKALTFSIPQNGNDIITTQFFNGKNWQNISQDTMPTIHLHNSQCIFSKYTDNLYVTGQYHLWEYDGKDWKKHAIYDTLYHRRRFEGMIELADSSLLITAFSQIVVGSTGSVVHIGKIYHELLKFKNGVFTTVKSRWSEPQEGFFSAYQKLKLNKNGTYTILTFEEADRKYKWEYVTYSVEGNILRKDTIPNLKNFGFIQENVRFTDYLFDSKGSFWLLTQSYDEIKEDSTGIRKLFINFVGLVEIKQDGTIFLYNDNIGIQKSTYRSNSFSIDDEDNIWFVYSHLKIKPHFYPSIYKLHSDRKVFTEYTNETIFKNSIFYNGGNSSFMLESPSYSFIDYSGETKSIYAGRNGPPLLQFFPDNITSIKDREIENIQLYPNPVSFEKIITIQNSKIGNNQEIFYKLSDINGNVVKEERTFSNENQIRINTENLISGCYIVMIFKNNKSIIQSVFIKE